MYIHIQSSFGDMHPSRHISYKYPTLSYKGSQLYKETLTNCLVSVQGIGLSLICENVFNLKHKFDA